MGLAASQARLLTITNRKSRAQFDSMRLSHQRLALSRNLTDISNEYQNSLDQTKLYYDFYGVNSTDTPLTYNMLMAPSSLNDYTPTLITNNQGRVVLSNAYALAAESAGIPQEGLGCTPSSLVRDAFIQSLAQQGVITQGTADIISAVDYNQGAGLGNDNLISTQSTTGDYNTLIQVLSGVGGNTNVSLIDYIGAGDTARGVCIVEKTGNNTWQTLAGSNHPFDATPSELGANYSSITLGDLLSGTKQIYLAQESDTKAMYVAANNVLGGLASELLENVAGAEDAVAYANMQMSEQCWGLGKIDFTDPTDRGEDPLCEIEGDCGDDSGKVAGIVSTSGVATGAAAAATLGVIAAVGATIPVAGWIVGGVCLLAAGLALAWDGIFGDVSDAEVAQSALQTADAFLASADRSGESGWLHDDPHDQAALDLSAYTQAWFTYFMQYMYTLSSPEANELSVKWQCLKSASNFANKDNCKFQFTFVQNTVSENEALVSNFYDTLFNQICMSGWTQNDQVEKDSSYLKEMLQTGMMYLTSMADDCFFYQNNYATNSFIKEVADEAAIAAAESKYTTEKARINAKEQELDLKMKNLDTEISSLETEYEAVKKVIEGNVSKSFTRYDG